MLLVDQPVVNAVIDDVEIVYRDYVDISVAVSTPKVFASHITVLYHNEFKLFLVRCCCRANPSCV